MINDDNDEKNWRYDANCAKLPADTDIDFFAIDGPGMRKAKQVCVDCPVRRLCLEDALQHEDRFGVWGGVDENELMRALSINQFGLAVIREAKLPRCPFCLCEDLNSVEKRRTRTHVECARCKFDWWTRRSMPKKTDKAKA